mgnify:CR=1 FL=1
MLNIQNLTFSYNKTNVLQDVSFSVEQGEHISIIGESGSGKSTLLKLIYGEYDLDKGHVFWNETEVLGPKHNLVVGYSFMKYVSQEFDLMPYISVEENIGSYLSNFYPKEKKERINELLEIVELLSLAKTKVKLLSGGQKQRVALARAIAKRPEIMLMDEPFSHIDSFKKQSLRRKLFAYLKEKRITCIVATHDKEDVLGYSDRVLVLENSKIIANNSPEQLFENPSSKLVASFFVEFNFINETFVYAHQIKIVANSNLKAIVKKSYFKGSHFLIEARFNNTNIYIKHATSLMANKEICIKIK